MPNYYQNDRASHDWPASPHPQGQRPPRHGPHTPVPNAPETRMEQQRMPGTAGRTPAVYDRYNAGTLPSQQPTPPTSRPIPAPSSPSMEGHCLPLAMAWFADQKIESMYDPETGMERGTLFPELDKPWLAPQRRSAK